MRQNDTETIYYLYDREDRIGDYDANGNLIIAYTHGPGIDEPVAMTMNGNTYFYIPDIQVSIRAIIDTDGNAVATYQYDAWGNIISYNGTLAKENDYLYTGREYDWETGIYYYRARYYNPELGRFLSQDPAGMVDGPNMYIYVKNDPVNGADPSGMDDFPYCDLCKTIAEFALVGIIGAITGLLTYEIVASVLSALIVSFITTEVTYYLNLHPAFSKDAEDICSGLSFCPYYVIHASYGETISAGVVLTVGAPFPPVYIGGGGRGRLGPKPMGFTERAVSKPYLPAILPGSWLWRWTV